MLRQQQNSANPTNNVAPQSTSSVTGSTSQQAVTPRYHRKPISKRRWWYLGVLVIASGVTGAELVGRTLAWAEATGRRPITSSMKTPLLSKPTYLAYTESLNRIAWFERDTVPNKLRVLDFASKKILWTRADLPHVELTLNKDGTLLFVGRHVLDASSGTLIHTAPAPEKAQVSWSDNGQIAAWKSLTTVKGNVPTFEAWNATQKKQRKLKVPADLLDYRPPVVSPDGRWIIATSNSHLYLVAVDSVTPTRHLQLEGFSYSSFSPDSKKIVIRSETYLKTANFQNRSSLKVWSTETGSLLQSKILDKHIYEAKWSQDSRHVITHGEYQYDFLDTATGRNLWRSPKFEMGGEILTLTHDRQLVTINKACPKNSIDIQISSTHWNLSNTLPR